MALSAKIVAAKRRRLHRRTARAILAGLLVGPIVTFGGATIGASAAAIGLHCLQLPWPAEVLAAGTIAGALIGAAWVTPFAIRVGFCGWRVGWRVLINADRWTQRSRLLAATEPPVMRM